MAKIADSNEQLKTDLAQFDELRQTLESYAENSGEEMQTLIQKTNET